MKPSSIVRHLSLAILTLAAAVCFAPPTIEAQCTAYGDPPATLIANIVPLCTGGTRLGPWNDADGTPRYACLYEPEAASASAPLPMLVFIHPSLVTADSLEESTNLLDYNDTYDLSGNPSRPGFIVLAPEGRDTTHYYPSADAVGPGWDNWYRQFNPAITSPPENVDAATIDHFIASVTSTGIVDQKRLFLSGWSNGAAMAYEYGLNRSNIASIAVYSAPDPYAFTVDPCQQTPVTGPPPTISQIGITAPQVATYQVHNLCDLAGICPNTERLETRLRGIGVVAGDQIIGSLSDPLDPLNQDAASVCDSLCGTDPDGDSNNALGGQNHTRWPTDWTTTMLAFLAAHPQK
jgi:poly(3-hydroxybutyrate) depolymerase